MLAWGPGTWVEVPAETGGPSTERVERVSDQAIIKTGGKQYRVAVGDKLRVEKLELEVGVSLDFDQVLLVGQGAATKVGTPVVAGAKVSGKIIAHGKGKKLIVYKFRRRKQYRRKNGHRQPFTEVQITGISA
jgi:large subunit ribosomal protein L21